MAAIRARNRLPEPSDNYDVIVIGSGMGGLTTASLLARVGRKRVLVLESHFKLGGFTHSFRRQGYEWDAGLHYVGEMQPQAMTRKIMDLVTDRGVAWNPMGKVLERFCFPGRQFEVASDPDQFQADLIQAFPHEATGIRRVFRDAKKMQGWSTRWFISKTLSQPWSYLLTRWGRTAASTKTQEYLNSVIQDQQLKAILTGQWPDYGTPPEHSAWSLHATVFCDFLHGGWYPVGGSKMIASAAQKVIEGQGGACLVSHPVQRILVENNRVQGVVVNHKGKDKEFRAPCVISNAGAFTTFGKLLDADLSLPEQERVRQCTPGASTIILFLGLNADPRTQGFDDANYWIFNSFLPGHLENPQADQLTNVEGAFLSFGSLRNPEQTQHTAQIISFSNYDLWQEHQNTTWQKRGENYEEKKARVSAALLDFVCERYPQLRPLIAYQELSTPLSVESFTSHPGGMIYGQPCTPDRLFANSWQTTTSVKNLYLTGSDVGMPGINGAMMAGVMTAAKALGSLGFPRIFSAAYAPSRSN